MQNWETQFRTHISQIATAEDPAHDLLHFERVVKMAKTLCAEEGGNPEIVVPAAWLHDLVIVPKNDPRRSQASRLSADAAVSYLSKVGYPSLHLNAIAHAVACHSFSANITPETLEARIVQDADRLDGLGAIGLARCFATAGLMKRVFYSPDDPFCETRAPDDQIYTIDHFYKKLFKTAETLQTASGRREGERRVEIMRRYLSDLRMEIR